MTAAGTVGTATFSLHVGRLAAGRTERALRERAHGHVDVHIDTHMGVLGGVLLVTAHGTGPDLASFVTDVETTFGRST